MTAFTRFVFVVALAFAGASGCSFADVSYYRMVDEVMAAPDQWTDKELRIHGWVEAGSITENIVDQTMTRTFVLENKGKQIKVTHTGPAPDTFRDLSEVVAEGTLLKRGPDYVFEAKNLTAKCPSKYQGANQNRTLADKPVFSN